jgi:hypothetical protein
VLAAEAKGASIIEKNKPLEYQVDADGEICLAFTNMDEAYDFALKLGDLKIESITINYVAGKHLYSAAGTVGYMGKGSKPSYEINRIVRETYNGTIPKNAFGYILIKTKK